MDLKERATSARRHPWEVARADHVLALLKDASVVAGPLRVLDAGSGDSYVAGRLAAAYPGASVVCWDAHYTDEDLRTPPAGMTRVTAPPEGQFDVLLALDVIEHVEDDVAFLRELAGRAAPSAVLVVTVPAYQRLFTRHDTYLGHYRRYSRTLLRDALVRGGWEPSRLTGFFSSLLPVRAAAALAERWTAPKPETGPRAHLGTWDRGPVLTQLLAAVLRADARAARAVSARRPGGLPGLSICAVSRRGPASES